VTINKDMSVVCAALIVNAFEPEFHTRGPTIVDAEMNDVMTVGNSEYANEICAALNRLSKRAFEIA